MNLIISLVQPSKLTIFTTSWMTQTLPKSGLKPYPVFRLIRISLIDNPVWEEEDLRIRLLIKINSLKVINKEEVTEDELLEVKELLETQNEEED